jgi:hypothetical protein
LIGRCARSIPDDVRGGIRSSGNPADLLSQTGRLIVRGRLIGAGLDRLPYDGRLGRGFRGDRLLGSFGWFLLTVATW